MCVCGVCLRGIDLLSFVDYVTVMNGKKPELDLLDNHLVKLKKASPAWPSGALHGVL